MLLRLAAWGLLLCVGYQLLLPLQQHIVTKLTPLAPAAAVSTPSAERMIIDRLEARLEALEVRMRARERELQVLIGELKRLSERDRWTHQLLDDVGDSILDLREAVCPLQKHVAEPKVQ